MSNLLSCCISFLMLVRYEDMYEVMYEVMCESLHQHRPQTVGYTLGHILCLFSLNAPDLRCLCGFIWFLSPNGNDMPVWFQSAPGPGLAGAGAGAGIRS